MLKNLSSAAVVIGALREDHQFAIREERERIKTFLGGTYLVFTCDLFVITYILLVFSSFLLLIVYYL